MSSNGTPQRSALLVIDMINPYDHPGSEELARNAASSVPVIAAAIAAARERGDEVIYVNDNRGEWNESTDELVEKAMEGAHPELVAPIAPAREDPFVVKLRHSAFFATPLEHLLRKHGVGRVVICGQVTEQCVLYTAIDAYMRDFSVAVPRDAVAHIDRGQADAALELIAANMDGDVRDAASLLGD